MSCRTSRCGHGGDSIASRGRASARSWLYRIATNACLTALRGRSQRTLPDVSIPPAPVGGPLAPPVEEARWIQPFPTGADVRARARIARFRGRRGVEAKIAPLSPGQQQLLRSYVKAWEAGDVDAIVALFSRDASASMPPFATWYRGRAAIARWLTDHALADGRAYRLFPTFANGRPSFAFYKSGGPCLPGEPVREAFEPQCIQVVWLARRQVTRIVSFLSPRLVKEFGFGPRPPLGSSKK